LPHLWPTGSSSGWPPSITARYFSSCPSDSTSRWTPCPPGISSGGSRSALVCFRLSPSCPFRPLHTFHSSRPARNYPRFWIQRSSSERRRDFNPPDQRAAQRTLWPSPTPRLAAALSGDVRIRDSRQPRASPTDPDHLPCLPCSLPRWTEQVLVGWAIARSRAGFLPCPCSRPVSQAGRRPHLHFRGLLKLPTRYGLPGCSPTRRGLYREAPP